MCNDYRLELDVASILEDLQTIEIQVSLPEGTPNVPPRTDIRMTDVSPVVRGIAGARASGELVNRRWSWPGPTGKPVYNFRSEGRSFTSHRCLILTDGFYEFTKPADPKQKRQDKWLFTMRDHAWFCIAGIWRSDAQVGEAFTMLTTDAGPDIAPYHHRQIIPLRRDQWVDWLDPSVPAQQVLRHQPAGSILAARVYPVPAAGAADRDLLRDA
jgi:putative SOS response-associated peptidase YedK